MTAALVLAVGLLAAGAPDGDGAGPAVREQARYLMGTLAVVRAEGPDQVTADRAAAAAWAALDRVDSLFSTWQDGTDLARANAGAAAGPVAVAPEVARLAAAALDLAGVSGGAFDPTVLPLLRAWGLRGDGEPRVPDAAALAAARAVTGAHLVRVDTTAATIAFARPGVALDLGGLAKGHALDAARAAMTAAGATGGLVDLGGGLLAFGTAAPDSVAVVAPDDPQAAVARVALGPGAVATSGQYERFVEIDGRAYGHILDPRTGRPMARRGSVTVTAASGRLADGLATAAFVLGPEAGAALVARHPGARCVFVVPAPGGGWEVLRAPDAAPRRTR